MEDARGGRGKGEEDRVVGSFRERLIFTFFTSQNRKIHCMCSIRMILV